jgi:hypothetical protein
VLTISLALLAGSIPPHVEDPWPDRIGLGFPFALAGAAGVLAGVIHADASADLRDGKIRRAGQIGFWWGAGIYAISLAVQVISGL